MVDPADVPTILTDAARLIRDGEIVVFGSAALAFWLDDAPKSRDVDVFCSPTERGKLVEALMGELSWYHKRHSAYVEVWAPETFAAPLSWRERARTITLDDAPNVRVIAPHPHDLLMSKLERADPKDWEHISAIVRQLPLSPSRLKELVAEMPHTLPDFRDPARRRRFEHGLELLTARFLRS